MAGAQWLLELVLLLLLAATLFHALRLERALGVLKRDRAVLESLVDGFNNSTRQAETGIERLRSAADGAGRQMARQIESAQRLRDDMSFLTDRGERLAERLEAAVRSARMFADGAAVSGHPPPASLQAAPASSARLVQPARLPERAEEAEEEAVPRLRSQAERDLLRALRAGR
jgi:phage shock protein A